MNKVNYKQFGVTREEREQNQDDIIRLRPYIMALKERDLGVLKCEQCEATDKPLDIHHKKYGDSVNYYDLALLCEDCHKNIQPSKYD